MLANARDISLCYVTDAQPGIRRVRPVAGGAFTYVTPDDAPVTDAADLHRIEALRIPPAWTDVWICPDPLGHLQATGRDARGRKQYRYHDEWRRVRDRTKFDRMVEFGSALSAIRRRADRDLSRHALCRDRVVAAVVRILDESLVRVGNPEYLRQNDSYGLTTLEERHADIAGTRIRFEFRGKAGKEHVVCVSDPRLVRVVTRARDLPGQALFQYRGRNGTLHAVRSEDVNEYLYQATGEHFTSKDFRTWGGTAVFTRALLAAPTPTNPAHAEKSVIAAVRAAADALGNTPPVCRRSYIHPGVIDRYFAGELHDLWERARHCRSPQCELLRDEERTLLELLKLIDRR